MPWFHFSRAGRKKAAKATVQAVLDEVRPVRVHTAAQASELGTLRFRTEQLGDRIDIVNANVQHVHEQNAELAAAVDKLTTTLADVLARRARRAAQ